MSKRAHPPNFRSRIVDHGEASPTQLMAHPKNWRRHPEFQGRAVEAVLKEVGWVQQVVVNRRTGLLVDGHLRVEIAKRRGERQIPVLYVDLTEAEEAKILATLDPLAALAQTDQPYLDILLRDVETEQESLQQFLNDLATAEHADQQARPAGGSTDTSDRHTYGGTTSIARSSAPLRYWQEAGLLAGDVLDFGCGQEAHGFQRYDAFTQPDTPLLLRQYDTVMCNYVLNTQPADHLITQICALLWHLARDGGHVLIAVRNDLTASENTSRGWQIAKPAQEWAQLIGDVFAHAEQADATAFHGFTCPVAKGPDQ